MSDVSHRTRTKTMRATSLHVTVKSSSDYRAYVACNTTVDDIVECDFSAQIFFKIMATQMTSPPVE